MTTISFVKVLVKELVESVMRRGRLVVVGKYLTPKGPQLVQNGIEVIGSLYTRERCEELRRKIDSLMDDETVNVWHDDEGADHRIYFADHLDEDFSDFYNNAEIRSYLFRYLGISDPAGMVLAARIRSKNGNKGSGGGWHRDSPVRHQLKAICYLSDVGPLNGPFQLIKGSHRKRDVITSYIRGLFKPGQYRFEDHEVNSYLDSSKRNVCDVLGSEGTLVLADTKALHRGKPIDTGVRYALFCYFWDKNVPVHFDKYRQKTNIAPSKPNF